MTSSPLATARALFRRNASLNMTPEERVELAHTCARIALEYGGPDPRSADECLQSLLDDTAGITDSTRCWPDEEPTDPIHDTDRCPPPEGCA